MVVSGDGDLLRRGSFACPPAGERWGGRWSNSSPLNGSLPVLLFPRSSGDGFRLVLDFLRKNIRLPPMLPMLPFLPYPGLAAGALFAPPPPPLPPAPAPSRDDRLPVFFDGRAMARLRTSSSSNNSLSSSSISVTTSSSHDTLPLTRPPWTLVSNISTCDPGGNTRSRVTTDVAVLRITGFLPFFFFRRIFFIFFLLFFCLSLSSAAAAPISDFLIIFRFTTFERR
mmetsp:Transcript_19038/g.45721  ORF Transcript_19038/g.45721 Transcript_19038/m.45721 type:complete len:226 (+) Transcript_19038:1569-2246(+)